MTLDATLDAPPPTKKERERHYLEMFLRLHPLDLAREPEEGETPDFVLTLRDGRRVGIELVGADDGPQRKAESLVKRLSDEVRAEIGDPDVTILIGSYSTYALGLGVREVRARATAVIADRVRTLGDELLTLTFDDLVSLDLPYLWQVGIGRPGREGHVHFITPSIVVGTGHDRLPEVVRRKDAVVANCRAHVPDAEQWLLVHADASLAAHVAPRGLDDVSIESKFDRVFIVNLFHGDVRELTSTVGDDRDP